MSSDSLKVLSCDLQKTKNGINHHTDQYDVVSTRLVVRRGQAFSLRLTLSRDTEFPSDKIRFELHTGGSPRSTHKSRIYLDRIEPKVGEYQVGVVFSSVNKGYELDLEVFTPSDMGAGRWVLWMYSRTSSRRSVVRSVVASDIIMTFNAWNKDDTVYMENEKWRNEYVLNDTGMLYFGTSFSIGAMDWYFGQFESEVLDAALKLLGMESLLYRDRGDAIQVCRHMSALVNANDDDGVLVGRWAADFPGGTSPTDWIGSYAILKEYMEKGQPVNYGQCWVFSGVLCSVLRTLGIPARSVTNFSSAHDTHSNLIIDHLVDEKYEDISNDRSNDSIWNFHVWNDVWMARPDLQDGFGGWQALDATPQELSGGSMRCGPMSVNAIKQGLINMEYDGPFIYAEVNGKERFLRRILKGANQWEDEYEEYSTRTSSIGRNMSTKQVGNDRREDVTHIYKFPESSPEEELSFRTARKFAKFEFGEKKAEKVLVELEGDIPNVVPIGADIVATFKFKNISSSTQDVFMGVLGKVMLYNGSIVAKIHDIDIKERIAAGKTKEVTTTIKSSTYLARVKNNNSIKIFALGGVTGGDNGVVQTFGYNDTVELKKPKLEIKTLAKAIEHGKETEVTITFKNPLSIPLKPGKLRLEGAGIKGVLELAVGNIKASANFTKTVTVKPMRVGKRKLIVGFSSPSLSGIQGSITLTVGNPK